jgi:hypothetical protein
MTSAWLDRLKCKIDARADHASALSTTEKLLLLRAARLVTRLEQIEQLGDALDNGLCNSTSDARQLFFSTSCDLRHTMVVLEHWRAAA